MAAMAYIGQAAQSLRCKNLVGSWRFTPTSAGVYYVWSYWTSGSVPYRLVVDQAAAPTIASISPTSGPVGTEVVITGTSLHTVTAVRFGGDVPATDFTATPISITVTVPAGASGGEITVDNPTGSATSAQSFTVTPTNTAPTVTLNAPVDGATVGGVSWSATADEADVASVTFAVGGVDVEADSDGTDGWSGTWDATLEAPGPTRSQQPRSTVAV